MTNQICHFHTFIIIMVRRGQPGPSLITTNITRLVYIIQLFNTWQSAFTLVIVQLLNFFLSSIYFIMQNQWRLKKIIFRIILLIFYKYTDGAQWVREGSRNDVVLYYKIIFMIIRINTEDSMRPVGNLFFKSNKFQ